MKLKRIDVKMRDVTRRRRDEELGVECGMGVGVEDHDPL